MSCHHVTGKLIHQGHRESAIRYLDSSEDGPKLWCGIEGYRTEGDYLQRAFQESQISMIYVIEGGGTYVTHKGTRHPYAPGDVFIRYPYTQHELHIPHDTLFSGCFLAVPHEMFRLLCITRTIPESLPVVIHPGIHKSIPARFKTLLDELRTQPYPRLSESAARCYQLLVDLWRFHAENTAVPSDEGLIEQACLLIDVHIDERFTMEEVAHELHCSYSRFRKLFRKHMGIAPGDYQIRRRIERAQELLCSPHIPLKEIAFKLGYPDLQTFSKQFKRVTGMPPTVFQKERLG